MSNKKNHDSHMGQPDERKNSVEFEANTLGNNISNLLDNYDIEVLDAHLEQCIKKNSKLKKRNKKLREDLELMTKCFLEIVEKNYRLEEELKNLKKEDPL